jgi:hypothetical protein
MWKAPSNFPPSFPDISFPHSAYEKRLTQEISDLVLNLGFNPTFGSHNMGGDELFDRIS